MATPPMHKMAYPIETELAYKFWGSRHLCNRLKAIIAFSRDMADANFNLRRFGFQTHLRLRALESYGNAVGRPDMENIPFTPMEIPWYECLDSFVPPKNGRWAVWDDTKDWSDSEQWVEWIPDPDPIP